MQPQTGRLTAHRVVVLQGHGQRCMRLSPALPQCVDPLALAPGAGRGLSRLRSRQRVSAP